MKNLITLLAIAIFSAGMNMSAQETTKKECTAKEKKACDKSKKSCCTAKTKK
jgi:hypothetical protein